VKPHRLVIAGFGAFSKRVEVDFDELSRHGLYLIVGETGSGKTTIFDAMTFALYGKVAGNRSNQTIASDYPHRDEPYVEFEFSHQKSRYIIKRKVISDDKSDATVEKLPANDSEGFVKTGKREIESFITKITHLDADQFMKVVLLPQGKFQDFLVAPSKDREKLLQALFGTLFYSSVSDSMFDRAQKRIAEAKAKIQKLESDEAATQQIIDGLVKFELAGEIPRLEFGFDATLMDLKDRYESASLDAKKTSTAALEIAKQFQAATEGAELFDASKSLKMLLEEEESSLSQVVAANAAIEAHLKAEPVTVANDAKVTEVKLQKVAHDTVASSRKLLTDTVRENKSESLVSELSEKLDFGVSDINSYIATAKSKAKSAKAKYEEIRILQSELVEAKQTVSKCQKRSSEIKSEIKILSQKLNAAATRQRTEQSAISKLSRFKNEVLKLDTTLALADIVGAKSRLAKAELAYRKARDSYESISEQLKAANDIHVKHLAGLLSSKLKHGENCPVCGSQEHPRKAKKTRQVNIDKLEARRTLHQRNLTRAESEMKTCQIYLKNSKEASKKLPSAAEQKKLRSRHQAAADASKNLEKTTKHVASFTKHINRLEIEQRGIDTTIRSQSKIAAATEMKIKNLFDEVQTVIAEEKIDQVLLTLKNIQRVVKQVEEDEGALKKADGSAMQAVTNLQKVLIKSGFESVVSAIAALKQKSELDRLNNIVEEDKKRRTSIVGLEGRVKGKIIPASRPDPESISRELEMAEFNSVSAAAIENALSQTIDLVEKLIESSLTIGVQAKSELAFAESVGNLASLFKNGRSGAGVVVLGLERWVQRSQFFEVCMFANQYLNSLMNGRYQLTLDPQGGREKARAGGLDLYVVDSENGQTRPVQTLSGGETFLVALALAFALAEVVKSLFGGIELSSLFIDEGFGTLDSQTLDAAIALLESKRNAGVSIGIVTHVREMKESLPTGLNVVRTVNGSSIKQLESFVVVE